jgi:hypothetical protein
MAAVGPGHRTSKEREGTVPLSRERVERRRRSLDEARARLERGEQYPADRWTLEDAARYPHMYGAGEMRAAA